MDATRGASGLAAEADQVCGAWDHVIRECAEAINHLARLRSKIDEQSRSLAGRASPTSVSTTHKRWIERQRQQLPAYITSGFYRDKDGNTDVVQSGRDTGREHQDIADHLRKEGFPPGGVGGVTVGEHVEGKVAWRLRNSGERYAELVINNVMCGGPFSCKKLLPYILRPGQTMTVHDPVSTRTFHGRSER